MPRENLAVKVTEGGAVENYPYRICRLHHDTLQMSCMITLFFVLSMTQTAL